ncbi:MAG: D-TA family PLP-dependent enzyme [Saprospiraceae bacterium]|jgi:D-serine deaminase-like pyridoxal phosphate-dependent protein|nr:D-TA family PLP-dependent enzyme [Saprospiraceae bacterium]
MTPTLQNIAEIDSPALVILKEQVAQNIANAVRMVGDVSRLRPHVKTHKSADVTKHMLAAGITKFKCATIAEAEMLGQCGAQDVLLAYQPVGPKVRRLVAVVKSYPNTRFSCLVDDFAAAKNMATIFAESDLIIPVFIDLNIGQNRTGIAPEKAFDLYKICSELKGIKPIGLQAYDGHIRDINFGKRTAECDAAFKAAELVASQIAGAGFPAPIIVAGGSPTFPIHAMRSNVECSPGTFVYWDKGYSDLCPEQPFQPAAWLLTRVISRPDATKICLDLGHKSVAAENDIAKRIFFPKHPDLIPIGQSEEHLVMDAGLNHGFNVGDILTGIPYHICPTVALYEKVMIIENEKVIGEWKTTARDRYL